MTTGTAVYFDGLTSARRDVAVEAAPEVLWIRASDGTAIAQWLYSDLLAMSAPDHVLRLGRRGASVLARLDVRDPALAATIDDYAHGVDRSGATERRERNRVIAWAFGATVSLIFVALVVLPALVARLTPLIPLTVEHRLGASVDAQVRAMLDPGKSDRPFECGSESGERAGKEAFDRLIARMERAAGLPIPIKAAVVRRTEANAIALPGGYVYVFNGLIRQARSPDELAGVIAHEIGHVANRDGTRSILQAAGLSFLFGMMLGDFTGGGVVVIAAQTLMKSAYSREVETAADHYAVGLMTRIGGDGRALGTILDRIAGQEKGITILRDHPVTSERISRINAIAPDRPDTPLLNPEEWAALKRVCG